MASMGDSVGEGGADRDFGDKFVNTGYGTYQGQGNVSTGYEDMEGTGYDEHGQVKTKFGRWPISYDPVTGTANAGVTEGYHFPAEESGALGAMQVDFGGLVDMSVLAAGHTTTGNFEQQKGEEGGEEPAPRLSLPSQGLGTSEGEGGSRVSEEGDETS